MRTMTKTSWISFYFFLWERRIVQLLEQHWALPLLVSNDFPQYAHVFWYSGLAFLFCHASCAPQWKEQVWVDLYLSVRKVWPQTRQIRISLYLLVLSLNSRWHFLEQKQLFPRLWSKYFFPQNLHVKNFLFWLCIWRCSVFVKSHKFEMSLLFLFSSMWWIS